MAARAGGIIRGHSGTMILGFGPSISWGSLPHGKRKLLPSCPGPGELSQVRSDLEETDEDGINEEDSIE